MEYLRPTWNIQGNFGGPTTKDSKNTESRTPGPHQEWPPDQFLQDFGAQYRKFLCLPPAPFAAPPHLFSLQASVPCFSPGGIVGRREKKKSPWGTLISPGGCAFQKEKKIPPLFLTVLDQCVQQQIGMEYDVCCLHWVRCAVCYVAPGQQRRNTCLRVSHD